MKTATVRDLRNNFSKLEAWLGEGEEIQIEKRGKPIAFLSAIQNQNPTLKKVDWEARRKAIWGDRCLTAEEVKAMRDAELEGEEG